MPTVHTRYVTWISRGHRHHGSAAADLVSPLATLVPSAGTYQAWASPSISWTDGMGPHSASFAFWSVTGAAGGGSVSTNQSLSVSVGGTDVSATAWYIEGGGSGQGLLIDAFDVNQGTFVDDPFVDVVTDASLTAAANNDGFVPTASAEDVRAYSSIHAVPFDDWQVFVGTEVISNRDLQAAQRSSAVAFAFYVTPQGGVVIPPNPSAEWTWVSWGVKVDGGGPTGHGPVPPWNPYVREFATGLAMADAALLARPALREAALQVAAKQVAAAASSITKQMQSKALGKSQ